MSLDLNAIRARADAATEGPWHPVVTDEEDPPTEAVAIWLYEHEYVVQGEMRLPDAEFIAHARADVPALLAIAQAALYREGTEDCLQGECDHTDGDTAGSDCSMVDTRFATADDAVQADLLQARIDDIRDLMGRGINDAELREQIGRLLESWTGTPTTVQEGH